MDDRETTATIIASLAAIGVVTVGAWYIFKQQADGNGVCAPGNVQYMQCPDGSMIIVQQCENGQWVPTGLTCDGQPGCIDGEVETELCPDGSQIITRRCIGGVWYDTGLQCSTRPIALEGRVVDLKDLTPIIGAKIQLRGRTYGAVYTAYSNHQAKYRFNDLLGDYYDIIISANGYLIRYHYNLDFRTPHPFLDAYDLTDVGNGLTLREPTMLNVSVDPAVINYEGGHWCCGSWTPKSRHPKPLLTGTVYDNDIPARVMSSIPVVVTVRELSDGAFFCSTESESGFKKLAVLTNSNGEAFCYYFCKTEKDKQRYFDVDVSEFYSVKGWRQVTPPLLYTGIITTTGASWVPDKTCYGECEKEFRDTYVSCAP